MDSNVTRIAKLLGKRGGEQTKKRGREYFSRIGKLGMAKRWGAKRRKRAQRPSP